MWWSGVCGVWTLSRACSVLAHRLFPVCLQLQSCFSISSFSHCRFTSRLNVGWSLWRSGYPGRGSCTFPSFLRQCRSAATGCNIFRRPVCRHFSDDAGGHRRCFRVSPVCTIVELCTGDRIPAMRGSHPGFAHCHRPRELKYVRSAESSGISHA